MSLYGALSRGFGGFFHTGDPEHPPPLHKNPWFLSLIVLAALPPLVHVSGVTRYVPEPPPVVAHLPEFSLIDQDGAAFTRGDLAGGVHITGFFFTSCTTICPRLLQKMATLEEQITASAEIGGYGDDIRFLAVSVDPTRDTPEKLRETIDRYGLDPQRWTLLTGPRDDVISLVEGGFGKMVGEETETAPGVFDIAHTSRLAIVDGRGGVRGFYGTEPTSEVRGMSGELLGTDFDGPEAIKGWARVIWWHQHAGNL